PPRPRVPALRALRRAPGGGQGVGRPPPRLHHRRDPPRRRHRPRDGGGGERRRAEGGGPAGHRPRLPAGGGGARRLRRRHRLSPAQPQRELLPHGDGGLAGRHAGHRQRRRRRGPVALRTVGRRHRLPGRRRTRRVPGAGRRRPRNPGRAGPAGPGVRAGQLHLGRRPRPDGSGAGGAAVTAVFRRRGAVVYGPYPPIPGAASAATLDTVRRLLAGGADVQVMSPTPSAAHDFADLGQPRGAWRFARRAAGADVLVVYLDAELVASPARRGQLPARTALAAALRSAGHATVHVPAEAEPVPAAWSKVVLAAADEVVVDPPAEDADALSSSASLGGAQPAPDAPA